MQNNTNLRIIVLGLALIMLALPVLAEEGEPATATPESAPVQAEPAPDPAPAPAPEPQPEVSVPAPEPQPEEPTPAAEEPAESEEPTEAEEPTPAPTEETPEQHEPSAASEEPPEPPAAEDELTPPPTEEPAEPTAPQASLAWELANEDQPLRLGDRITLLADLDAEEAAGLALQWQVATKAAEALAADEPEWVNISGASGLKYAFVVEEGMQGWRWRLCIDWGGDEPAYSDEIALPEVATEENDSEEANVTKEAEEVAAAEGEQDEAELPVASITFAANVPADEITYGTGITLAANIENPREGMQLQWQYALEGGEWQDIPDAAGLAYAYTLSEENEGYLWRLLITVPEAEATEDTETPTLETESVPEADENTVTEPEEPEPEPAVAVEAEETT